MTNGDFLSILFIALGLSADCFAVSLSVGVTRFNHSWLRLLRVPVAFGLFQTLMLIIGWLAGRTVVDLIADFDHWLAFGLLSIVAGKMIWESFHSKDDEDKKGDITRGILLITLSIATSIDSLAVGLSLSFLEVNIVLASLTIGTVAFLVTTFGLVIGKRVSHIVGERAEILGGIILIAIAFRILLEHLL